MKLTSAICAMVAAFLVSACADDVAVTYDKLPAAAREFISRNFPNEKPALITRERELTGLSYDIVFVSGVKLEFNRKGEWTEIECRHSIVDDRFIPEQIRSEVQRLYPGARYIKIEKEDGMYEVRLSNGYELEFNKKFVLVKIDD